MRNLILLLVVLICVGAYVRAQQPATWNSWMVALGTSNLAVSTTPADSAAPGVAPAPADQPAPPPAPAPEPVRVVPVGGLIKNGYFVAGEGYWQGDGTADPSGKGLVVTLNPTAWTRVYQTFPDPGTQDSIEVTYKLSPGLTVSRDNADYTDISKRLQISGFEVFQSIGVAPGQFYGTVGDPSANGIACEVFAPQLGVTTVQDYQHDYPTIPASSNTTFALAFPPGSGTVTLLTAYVKNR